MAELLQRLNSRHRLVLRLVLGGMHTHKQIATITGFDPQSISYIVNSPCFQDELARRRKGQEDEEDAEIGNQIALATEMLQREAPQSVLKLTELRDGCPDASVQLRASKEILQLAYGPANGSGPLAPQVLVMQPEKLEFLMLVAKEAGIVSEKKQDGNRDDSNTNSKTVSSSIVSTDGCDQAA
jgi:hypothetical protein